MKKNAIIKNLLMTFVGLPIAYLGSHQIFLKLIILSNEYALNNGGFQSILIFYNFLIFVLYPLIFVTILSFIGSTFDFLISLRIKVKQIAIKELSLKFLYLTLTTLYLATILVLICTLLIDDIVLGMTVGLGMSGINPASMKEILNSGISLSETVIMIIVSTLFYGYIYVSFYKFLSSKKNKKTFLVITFIAFIVLGIAMQGVKIRTNLYDQKTNKAVEKQNISLPN